MQPFNLTVKLDGENTELTISEIDGYYEIIHQGHIIAALRPPGEDWQLLPLDELIEKVPLFESDLDPESHRIALHSPVINQIIAEIESR
ncbi:hypothetical protein GJU39_10455 [Pedobacter petrophilus]|uniref:Uncharacterized protein n=1 Tax=Pedobacter petrophilus TaxID=1908241 RepID=A0A7K0FYQ5_9SPHI|nr:hypothetical protein [Pedobacter petrophilus]MRX76512.1 hypothetical protein [Pedobacter petrophilus]